MRLSMSRFKTRFWALLTVVGIFAAIELSAHASLLVLGKWKHIYYHPAPFKLTETGKAKIKALINYEPPNTQLDPILGWAPKPSETILSGGSNGKPKTETINAQKIRGKRIHSFVPQDGIVRIAAFGDSYTFGSAASDEECWAEMISSSDKRVEVLNFGVGGYGLDQAFLRYQREGVLFNPHVVFICYMTENLARHVNVFRPFYSHFQTLPVSKPRFIVEADTLRLLDNPLPTSKDYEQLLEHEGESLAMLGQHDYFYQRSPRPTRLDIFGSVRLAKLIRQGIHRRYSINSLYKDGYYNSSSEAFEVTVKLLEEFYERVRRDGSIPIVVIFPYKKDIDRYQISRTKWYQPLLDHLRPGDLRLVDLIEAFHRSARSHEVSLFFDSGGTGHYSALGYEIVAKHLLRYLREERLLDADPMDTTAKGRTAQAAPPILH